MKGYKQNFPAVLWLYEGRGNGRGHNDGRSCISCHGRNAHKRKDARRTAAADHVLYGFIQSVPRRGKAADQQPQERQKQNADPHERTSALCRMVYPINPGSMARRMVVSVVVLRAAVE